MTTAVDSSGNSNHGTYMGTCRAGYPLLATDPQCTLQLRGQGWVEADAVVGDVASADPITVGLWYRPTGAGTLLAFNTNQPPVNDNRFATHWQAGVFGMNTPTPADTPQSTLTAASYPADGSAYFVVFEAGTSSQKIYVDGSLAATGSFTGTKLPVQSTDRFSIGQEFDSAPSELGFGDYGEAFVIAGTLTSTEISDLYDAGATAGDFAGDLLALSPDGYWRLNEICHGMRVGMLRMTPT